MSKPPYNRHRYQKVVEQNHREILKLESAQAVRLTTLSMKFDVLLKEQVSCSYPLEVLRILHLPEIRKRWYSIETADQRSNEWIFDRQKTSFGSWLESEEPTDGIFYITGKAGSGKSTLMKFIAEDSRTMESLEKWTGDSDLHQPSYYFWNQGTEMQKSGVGLFQSLLYQILRSAPDLIDTVCNRVLHHEPWAKEEWYDTFRCTEEETRLNAKFCFLIDGLDEYGGEEIDIIRLLEALSISGRIKICASSRPGRQYEAFLQRHNRMLDIVDLTQEDMQGHINVHLQDSANWRRLEALYPNDTRDIVDKVSTRADGVWLWVFLVTNDIVKEANKNEGIETLIQIVERFPDDLHKYSEDMIARIPKLHRSDMTGIFLVAVEEVQPLPLYAFALLEKEKKNPAYVLNCGIDATIFFVVDDQPHPIVLKHSVDFLHRTVRDFLRDYDLRAHLKTKSFNPLISLSRICLGLLKAVPVYNFRYIQTVNMTMALTDELLYYAQETEIRCNSDEYEPMVSLLDKLDEVNSHHARGIRNHWTHARDLPKARGLDDYNKGGNCNFIALAVQARIVKYGDRYWITRFDRRVTPILMPYHHIRDNPSVSVEMVDLLLSPEIAANPNQPVRLNGDRSVW
ncbi:hypothetical protein BU23DRAFT_581283 [Bimuria novae-zelandiae CBS 107.79]|uniref:Nephrocystin 3-like N-terminal domain-containing protein n=1 Tax=Bimuria novae-zelandiae CBS 107.79 TaxID=1447943 RepID=A0A6A5V3R9_9PLEO|nr:hypothetical protein BU23DRAFT_581283 [Bimuria novae-zelandiae CBS 107.79]